MDAIDAREKATYRKEVFSEALENGLLPQDAFDILSDILPEDSAIAAFAQNPKCPKTLLRHLAIDSDSRVRERVAGNPSCSPDVIARLASDESADVRNAAAENLSTPRETIMRLAKDEDGYVRCAAIRNPIFLADTR